MKESGYRLTRRRFAPERKAQLLDALARRPGAVADFAARHGIGTSTLFRWRRQAEQATRCPAQPAPGSKIEFQRVSLAPLLGSGGPWAGEVQLPDGTQVRWGNNPPVEVLLQVLGSLRHPC